MVARPFVFDDIVRGVSLGSKLRNRPHWLVLFVNEVEEEK